MPARNYNQGDTLRYHLHPIRPIRNLAALLALAPLIAWAQPATDATLLQSQTCLLYTSDAADE